MKLSALDKAIRLDETSELIGGGLKIGQIIDVIQNKYGVSKRQAERILSDSRKWILNKHKENRDLTRPLSINRYLHKIKELQNLSNEEMSRRDKEQLIKDYYKQIDILEGNALPDRVEVSKLEMKEITINISTEVSEKREKLQERIDRGRKLLKNKGGVDPLG
jgi:CHAT domain-containing protein